MLCHAAVAAFLLRFAYPRISFDRRRALLRWWSAKMLRILNVSTSVTGAVPPPGERGSMIAANHISWLDIFLISSVRPTRFIAKSEIRDWPLAGWIADKAGTLFIRRDQWRDTARMNATVRAALEQGDCVGLFPEGITTEGDRLLKFHSSLFEPAVANQAHVHPVAIRYEHPDGTLCREMSFIGERSFMESVALIIGQQSVVARVKVAAPVETGGATRREVMLSAETRIASLLNLPIARREPGRGAGLPAEPR
jgi:1-acyl-sn-glycerol-3-phosphate acyltransferase